MVKIESSKISHNCIHRFNYGERLSIRVNLDLKPYYKDYKSLLFYVELNRVEFSLCDQYSIICVSIIVFLQYLRFNLTYTIKQTRKTLL